MVCAGLVFPRRLEYFHEEFNSYRRWYHWRDHRLRPAPPRLHRHPAGAASLCRNGDIVRQRWPAPSASNAETWTHPSTLVKGLKKWMLRSDAPLLVNPSPSWHKISCSPSSSPAFRATKPTPSRQPDWPSAREHLFAWVEAEGIAFDHRREGILHIYRDRKGFEHAGRVSKLLPPEAWNAGL